MNQLDWKEDFNTGNEIIDKHRKNFLALTNELGTAIAGGQGDKVLGKIWVGLANYIKEGLAYEENLLKQCTYLHLAEHKVEHDLFKKEFANYLKLIKADKAATPFEIHQWLKSVFTSHVLNSDKKYTDLVKHIEIL